jgi:hypothetical protein
MKSSKEINHLKGRILKPPCTTLYESIQIYRPPTTIYKTIHISPYLFTYKRKIDPRHHHHFGYMTKLTRKNIDHHNIIGQNFEVF